MTFLTTLIRAFEFWFETTMTGEHVLAIFVVALVILICAAGAIDIALTPWVPKQ